MQGFPNKDQRAIAQRSTQKYADGGRVQPRGFVSGNGTGTSDSIKAHLSNGEYVLPADTVKAVGVQTLDALRAATHTPVKQEKEKAARGFFAGGTPGGVDEEKRKNSFGDAAASAANPGVTQVNTSPKPPEPAQSGAGFMPGVRSVYNESGKAIGDLASQGRYGAAAGETARAALSYVPAVADDVIGGALRAVGPGIMDAGRQFFGGSQKAPEPAAVPSAVAPAGMPGYKTDVQRGGGNVPAIDTAAAPAPAATSGQAPAAAPGPGDVTRVGNSYSGTNVSGDISINGQAPRNGGQVSAQNMAAADGLAARSQQESMARVMAQPAVGFQPAGVTAPTVRHSGNDWQSRNDLRNAMVSATSIMNDGGKWDKHGKGVVSPERAYAAQLAGADAQLRGAQPGVDVAAMRENAGIQREGMQQTGANQRAGMGFQTAQQRLAMDQETQGFANRAAGQSEQLRNTLLDPNATPEQRKQAQQALMTLQGKSANGEWGVQVTPATKNIDGSTSAGSIVRYNKATGQTEVVQQPGQGGGAPSTAAVAALRADPKRAAEFDAKFGAGAARSALGS